MVGATSIEDFSGSHARLSVIRTVHGPVNSSWTEASCNQRGSFMIAVQRFHDCMEIDAASAAPLSTARLTVYGIYGMSM